MSEARNSVTTVRCLLPCHDLRFQFKFAVANLIVRTMDSILPTELRPPTSSSSIHAQGRAIAPSRSHRAFEHTSFRCHHDPAHEPNRDSIVSPMNSKIPYRHVLVYPHGVRGLQPRGSPAMMVPLFPAPGTLLYHPSGELQAQL